VIPQLKHNNGDQLRVMVSGVAPDSAEDRELVKIQHELLASAPAMSDVYWDFGIRTQRCGVSAARNLMAQRTDCPTLKFLDADDMLLPGALDWYRAQRRPEDVVTYGAQLVYQGGIGVGMRCCKEEDAKTEVVRQNVMVPSQTFISRAAFQAVGGFDEEFDFEEDWELWLKLRRRFGAEQWVRMLPGFVCGYWVGDEAERAGKVRTHQVRKEGQDWNVRAWLKYRYGVDPR